MTIVRAGLIGLGMMGRNHARVLRSLEGVELVGGVDQRGDQFSALGPVPVFDTIDQLLDVGIDMCVVALPTDSHLEAGQALASASVVTLIEKPLASTVAECDQLLAAFAATNTAALVGHIERFNPALQALRQRLENGELGEIYQISTRRQGPFPDRVRDVGVVKDLATHDLDLTAWVAGSAFSSVAAQTAHKTGRDYEDLIAVTGSLESGIVTNHLVNWLSPMKERVTTVTGEKGCFVANTLTADLTFWQNGVIKTEWSAISNFRGVTEGDVTRFAIPKPEPLARELAELRSAAHTGSHAGVSLLDGRSAVIVAEACLRAARTNTVQTIEGQE